MPYIYLFVIEKRSIVVICKNNNKILSSLNKGNYTDFFGKKKDKILYKKDFEIDIFQYVSMTKSLKTESILGFHITRGKYFLTIDNNIWMVHGEENNYKDLILFKEIMFL